MLLVIASGDEHRQHFDEFEDNGARKSGPLRKRRGLPKVHSGCVTCKYVPGITIDFRLCTEPEESSVMRRSPNAFGAEAFTRARPENAVVTSLGKPNQNRTRSIIPKNVTQTFHRPILVTLSETEFESPQQYQYFRFFCDEVGSRLAGGFSNELWGHIVLQASNQEPCIRQAISAIGALGRVMKEHKRGTAPLVNEDYRFAILEYGRALKGMKKAMPIRTTLIATLLVFCFENFLGNQASAFSQVQGAANLLREWMKERETRRIADRSLSPAPDVIEDVVFDSFHSTHMQVLSWRDTKISEAHSMLDGTTMYIAPHVPAIFSNSDEASMAFTGISREFLRFLFGTANSVEVARDLESDGFTDSAIWNKRYIHSSPAIRAFLDINNKIDQWHNAFKPLFDRTKPDDPNFVAVYSMKAQGNTLRIGFRLAFYPDTPAAVYLPVFREILKICNAVVANPSFVRGFVFDAGIVPSLTTLTRYGDMEIRKEAIKILLDIVPRREGAWDAAVSAKNAIELMRLDYEKMSLALRVKTATVSEAYMDNYVSGDESSPQSDNY
ncbi:NFX1-type zinc finger-containing 1 protein [Rutstroemia sp. NJR-2017a WRK4]|nr:NFX1-type zinc finger-containing 1 protein [Rutstroemia sp. NJR-2017a WRK4]